MKFFVHIATIFHNIRWHLLQLNITQGGERVRERNGLANKVGGGVFNKNGNLGSNKERNWPFFGQLLTA